MRNVGYTSVPGSAKGGAPVPKLKFSDAEWFQQEVENYFDSISTREELFVYKAVENEETEEIEKIEVPTGKFKVVWAKAPTMVGLGTYLNTDYRIFQDYETDKYLHHPEMKAETLQKLKHTIARARQICHEYTLDRVFNAKSANGPIFVLKTVYKDHGYEENININQNITDDRNEQLSLDNLSTEELRKVQETLSKALTDNQHQISKQSAEDAEYEDV